MVTVIINRRLSTTISFHNVIHGSRAGLCTGGASLESKLLQKFRAMREEVLYVIFLYLQKAYDAFNRDRCLEILEGCGVVPQDHRLRFTYFPTWEVTTARRPRVLGA